MIFVDDKYETNHHNIGGGFMLMLKCMVILRDVHVHVVVYCFGVVKSVMKGAGRCVVFPSSLMN